jgi:hypothetical protein
MLYGLVRHIGKVRFDFMPKDKKLYGLPPTQLTFAPSGFVKCRPFEADAESKAWNRSLSFVH